MLGNGFSHAVLFAWVVPTFGLNWFSEKKLADVWPLVAGLLAFILMVVHFVFVAKAHVDCGNGLHQGNICYPAGLRCLHPSHALDDQFGAPACACAGVLLPPVVAGFSLPLQLSFLKSDCGTMVGSFTSSYWLARVEAPGAKNETGMALRWHHHAMIGRSKAGCRTRRRLRVHNT